MKELKFRAWWIDAEEYVKVSGIDFINEEIHMTEEYKNGTYSIDEIPFDEVILEQYTGLKDKDGKEIYIGDIVEYSGYGKNIFEITSEIGSYMLSTNNVNLYKVFDDCWNDNVYPLSQLFFNQEVTEDLTLYDLEVIGNIHENKELLK